MRSLKVIASYFQVHISTEEEQTPEGERTVTLTGSSEAVLLAQFLVQSNIDMFKKDHQVRWANGWGDP